MQKRHFTEGIKIVGGIESRVKTTFAEEKTTLFQLKTDQIARYQKRFPLESQFCQQQLYEEKELP